MFGVLCADAAFCCETVVSVETTGSGFDGDDTVGCVAIAAVGDVTVPAGNGPAVTPGFDGTATDVVVGLTAVPGDGVPT